MPRSDTRRHFLARVLTLGAGALLTGCDRLSHSTWFTSVLATAEGLNRRAHHLLASRKSMAQEFSAADVSPEFRSNGTSNPGDSHYQSLASNNFIDYQLEVSGLVETPHLFSIAQLRALPDRTQITRHDCVEGWSAIGKWRGVRLRTLLERVVPKPQARYVVFYCADAMDDAGNNYYESIDLEDAYHEQTILAYELNDQPLPIANGAPLRVRIERQLGYKMAKYILKIALVNRLESIGGGNGGYWEDQGYEWYAGI